MTDPANTDRACPKHLKSYLERTKEEMSEFREFLSEQLHDPELKAEYDALESEFNNPHTGCIPNPETVKAIEEVEQGTNIIGPFYSTDEVLKELNSVTISALHESDDIINGRIPAKAYSSASALIREAQNSLNTED